MTTKRLATLALSALCVVLSAGTLYAQTFNGNTLNTAGNSLIPSTGTGGCTVAPQTTGGTVFQDVVAGLAAGTPVTSVQINLTHTFDSDLDIFLRAPNGEILELTSDNGAGNDNYTNTVFEDGAGSITAGAAPFTGIFAPEGTTSPSCAAFAGNIATLGAFTPGQNGIWELVIMDDIGADAGTMLSWSISFGFPPLSITKTHVGRFILGQTGTYTITVSNTSALSTVGTVTVSDIVPAGLTAIGISGPGWTCTQPAGPCTRTDALAPSASYPLLALIVSVSPLATSPQVNLATVTGATDAAAGTDIVADATLVGPLLSAVPMMSGSSVFALAMMLLALGCVSRYRSTVR